MTRSMENPIKKKLENSIGTGSIQRFREVVSRGLVWNSLGHRMR